MSGFPRVKLALYFAWQRFEFDFIHNQSEGVGTRNSGVVHRKLMQTSTCGFAPYVRPLSIKFIRGPVKNGILRPLKSSKQHTTVDIASRTPSEQNRREFKAGCSESTPIKGILMTTPYSHPAHT